MDTVSTIDWMLNHKGLAVAKMSNNDRNTVSIVKYSENKEEYDNLRDYAISNGYIVIYGKNSGEENRLGYYRN